MQNSFLKAFTALGLVVLMSCGILNAASGDVGSCDYPTTKRCLEYVGQTSITLMTLKSSCTSLKGTYRAEACNHTGSIGGCSIDEKSVMEGAKIISWYFPGAVSGSITLNSSADVQSQCTGSNLTFLAP